MDEDFLPVTNQTDKYLTNNDTNNLKVGDSLDPSLVAHGELAPALWPKGGVKRCQVSDGEKNVSFRFSQLGFNDSCRE